MLYMKDGIVVLLPVFSIDIPEAYVHTTNGNLSLVTLSLKILLNNEAKCENVH
jgi:hypothetical protein